MTDIKATIAAERTDLADLLEALPADQWDQPSLCEGWRVREVLAHILMPFRYSGARVLLEMLKARGSFNRAADRCARADAAALTPEEMISCLRANVDYDWKPPGGGYEGALSHDVIHGLDITVALGIDRQIPPERMRLVVDGMNPKSLKYFGVDLAGIELRADDLDWSFGTGEPLSGSAQDVFLVICGRKLPPGHLRGTAAPRFTRTTELRNA